MKDKVFAHVGSLMGGVVHNLNTPLMWVMGRAQLIQSRNERLEVIKDLPPEEIQKVKKKNNKDITSIQDGADKIDQILKSLGYKVQMVNEGYTSIELKEYLQMEINFLMADMRFKHETSLEISLDSRAHYIKGNYNALSYAVTGIIDTIFRTTPKGRTLKIALEDGIIRLACPQLKLNGELKQEFEALCRGLGDTADIIMDDNMGFEISLGMKDA